MAAIGGKHTKPEAYLRKLLRNQGLKYKLHAKRLPGSPDIVFPSVKVAVFCDGDFWHGRRWNDRLAKGQFKVRRGYWIPKIEGNMARDKRNNRDLRKLRWRVLRFWADDIDSKGPKIAKRIAAIIEERGDARLSAKKK